MTTNPQDIARLIDDIQKDLTYVKAKFVTLREYFASMNIVDTRPYICDKCELTFQAQQELDDHQANVHDNDQRQLSTECLGTEKFTGKPCPVCATNELPPSPHMANQFPT